MGGIIVLLVVIVLVLWILASLHPYRTRRPTQWYLERLGAYKATWERVSISRFRLLSVFARE